MDIYFLKEISFGLRPGDGYIFKEDGGAGSSPNAIRFIKKNYDDDDDMENLYKYY